MGIPGVTTKSKFILIDDGEHNVSIQYHVEPEAK